MDIVSSWLKDQEIEFTEKFILSGVSKRGWASYLASAIDQRVIAFIPIVFDFLNMHDSLHSHYKSLNRAYSFVVYDYFSFGITLNLDTTRQYDLYKLIDPYCN